jgi:hypothetical protein
VAREAFIFCLEGDEFVVHSLKFEQLCQPLKHALLRMAAPAYPGFAPIAAVERSGSDDGGEPLE